MGLIGQLLSLLFGNTNRVREVAEIFRVNAEGADQRDAAYAQAALQQFGAEFAVPRQGWFDRFMDGVNRIPRPALALGTLGLFVAAMADPVWFASRMQGIALVPEPMWWLMGAIVSFYFGARSQAKGADFQRSIAETLARTAAVTGNIRALDALNAGSGALPKPGPDAPQAPVAPSGNAALDDWRRQHAD
jgi:hypothetical protein